MSLPPRPFIVDDYDAIDLNMLTRMYIYDNSKIALIMYYSDPVIVECESASAAKMTFNSIMKVWKKDEPYNPLLNRDYSDFPLSNQMYGPVKYETTNEKPTFVQSLIQENTNALKELLHKLKKNSTKEVDKQND